jgi:hypothetical protein
MKEKVHINATLKKLLICWDKFDFFKKSSDKELW